MMNARLFMVALLLALFAASPDRVIAIDVQGIPDAGKPVAGSLVPAPEVAVQVSVHKGEWSSFASMEGDAEPIFLITGKVKNTSGKPLTYIKLQFELLDEDGGVVVRDYGYNRKAEELRDEAYESGKKTLKDMNIEPLTANAEDGFRFLFFKSDIPKFHSYRIRLLEGK
jgi:hypothetical protein